MQPLGLLIALLNSITHAVLYWSELVPFYQVISKANFKKLLTQSGDQTDILANSPADTLWLPKTVWWMLLYTTVMRTMYPPGYHHSGFVVITGRAHCFHDSIYNIYKTKEEKQKIYIYCLFAYKSIAWNVVQWYYICK